VLLCGLVVASQSLGANKAPELARREELLERATGEAGYVRVDRMVAAPEMVKGVESLEAPVVLAPEATPAVDRALRGALLPTDPPVLEREFIRRLGFVPGLYGEPTKTALEKSLLRPMSKPAQEEFTRRGISVLRRDGLVEQLDAETLETYRTQAQLQTALKALGLKDPNNKERDIPKEAAKSFMPGLTVKKVRFKKKVEVVRVVGRGALPIGMYYGCCFENAENGELHYDATGHALPDENSREKLLRIEIEQDAVGYIGVVAPDNGTNGGGVQIFLPFRNARVLEELIPKTSPIRDVTDVRVSFARKDGSQDQIWFHKNREGEKRMTNLVH
jgi:hypothetical protein